MLAFDKNVVVTEFHKRPLVSESFEKLLEYCVNGGLKTAKSGQGWKGKVFEAEVFSVTLINGICIENPFCNFPISQNKFITPHFHIDPGLTK